MLKTNNEGSACAVESTERINSPMKFTPGSRFMHAPNDATEALILQVSVTPVFDFDIVVVDGIRQIPDPPLELLPLVASDDDGVVDVLHDAAAEVESLLQSTN